MKKILKLKAQIKILNKKIENNNVKNIYAVKNKIRKLTEQLKIEMENYYWENYLSQ